VRDYQLEHLAYIAVSQKVRLQILTNNPPSPVSSDFIQFLHRSFYEKLPATLCVAKTESGKIVPIEPGAFRSQMGPVEK